MTTFLQIFFISLLVIETQSSDLSPSEIFEKIRTNQCIVQKGYELTDPSYCHSQCVLEVKNEFCAQALMLPGKYFCAQFPRSCHEALRSNSSEVRLKDTNKDINKLNGTLTDGDSGNYTLVGLHEDSTHQLTMNNTAHNQQSTAEKHTDMNKTQDSNNGNSVFVHKTLIYTVMGVLLLKISL